MAELRAAILGCGPRAADHAAAYAAGVASGRLVACCDLDGRRLEAFATRFGVPERFGDLGEMLRRVRPDLLHVVTAPPFRPAVLEVVLRERPPAVLVEKPLARRPSEGRAWLEGCAAAGVQLFVNHQLRLHRPFARLREVVSGGALGRLEFGRGSCRGNLLEQGTHLFDMFDFVLDGRSPAWVFAQAEGAGGYGGPHPAPDYVAGVIVYADGLHVAFECGSPAGTWRQEPSYWWNKGLEFVGERGRAGASTNHGWWAQTEAGGLEGSPVPYAEEDLRAQAALTEGILQALLRGQAAAHPCHARRARVSFELTMAVQRSALWRCRVDPRGPLEDADVDGLAAALRA
jgi:predicted dehydrogenase